MPEAEVEIALEGTALLTDPLLNKGMAFTEEERTAFGLHGLLPPHVATLHEQIERQLEAMRSYETALERHLFLCDVQDSNETLFYALVERNLKEMLPLVYTPTVGEACQQFSHYWRYPRGLFLSFPHRHDFPSIFAHPRSRHHAADLARRRHRQQRATGRSTLCRLAARARAGR